MSWFILTFKMPSIDNENLTKCELGLANGKKCLQYIFINGEIWNNDII